MDGKSEQGRNRQIELLSALRNLIDSQADSNISTQTPLNLHVPNANILASSQTLPALMIMNITAMRHPCIRFGQK